MHAHDSTGGRRRPAASVARSVLAIVSLALVSAEAQRPGRGAELALVMSSVGSEESPTGEAAATIREGTAVQEQVGHFSVQGERVSFQTDGQSAGVLVLENLALERIVHQVTESPKLLHWKVTGVITEYRGQNFLLISRAQMQPTVRRELPEL
jgi:hypothetical protein